VSAFVCTLEASPTAYVVNPDGSIAGCPAHYVLGLTAIVAPFDTNTALRAVAVGPNDGKSVFIGILLDFSS
jgi:hypothetical protein